MSADPADPADPTGRAAPADPAGRGAAGLALVATSIGLVALTAFLGPSVATRAPGMPGAVPPYDVRILNGSFGPPSPWLVVALLVTATATGVAGLLLARSALGRGWAPSPRRLLAGGLLAATALLLVPPTTSDDLYSYTAYGRMAALGHDPYDTTPNDIPGDPVIDEAGDPWRDVASVYGPVTTAVQTVALRVAGDDVRVGATLLAVVAAVAFAVTGLLLHAAAADDAARRRAALLWTLNPLLLMHLVAGAHVDALLVAFAVAAVLALRRSPLLAGALGAVAACVKLSGVLTLAALAWNAWRPADPPPGRSPAHDPQAHRRPTRRPQARLAALALGAVLVTGAAYVLVGGLSALGPVRRAARFVSFGSPWRALSVPLDHAVGSATSRAVVSALSLLAVATLCWLLSRAVPGEGTPRTAAVVTLAWLAGATYVLPWYDAWAWPFLALLPASRWDRWLAVRTAVLTVAYLPGRIEPMPPLLADLLSATRLYTTPCVLGLLVVVMVRWCLRPDGDLGPPPPPRPRQRRVRGPRPGEVRA